VAETFTSPGLRRRSIVYLSQCLPLRQEDASADGTYPFVAQHYVEHARPGLRIETTVITYFHPYESDLGVKFDRAERARPDVIVLEVPARPVAHVESHPVDLRRFPSGVRTAYQRFRHLRELNQRMPLAYPLDKLIHVADISLRAVIDGPLRRLVRRYPTPTLDEYEALVAEIIARLAARTAATLVLAGPAGFSERGCGDGYVDDAPQLYDTVNDMARRIAARHVLPFIDRVAVAGDGGTSFFLPGSSIVYAPAGHLELGRFVGATLLKLGVL